MAGGIQASTLCIECILYDFKLCIECVISTVLFSLMVRFYSYSNILGMVTQLQDDLRSNLRRLLDVSDDSFWRTGWVYTRVQHHIAFIYNGLFCLC